MELKLTKMKILFFKKNQLAEQKNAQFTGTDYKEVILPLLIALPFLNLKILTTMLRSMNPTECLCFD